MRPAAAIEYQHRPPRRISGVRPRNLYRKIYQKQAVGLRCRRLASTKDAGVPAPCHRPVFAIFSVLRSFAARRGKTKASLRLLRFAGAGGFFFAAGAGEALLVVRAGMPNADNL